MIEINYLSVLIVAFIVFFIGFLWYGPVFGKYWMKLISMTKEDMKSMKMTPAKAMIFGFIGTVLFVYVLSYFTNVLGITETSGALQLAFLVWFGFYVPSTSGSWLWEGKSFQLFVLNAGYYLVTLLVATYILVLM